MANEAGIDFDLFDVAEIMRDTPYFVDLRPGGKYVAKDLYEVGGVAVVMKELGKVGLLHVDCITASGKTLGESLDEITRRGGWPGDLSIGVAHHQDRRRGGR